MKTILLLLLTTIGYAQTNTKVAFDLFKKELDAYNVQSDIASKPAHCNEYVLKYTVNNEKVSAAANPPVRNLCDDLKAYNKNPSLVDWKFDIKPIGDQYYIITAERSLPSPIKLIYYYGRTEIE